MLYFHPRALPRERTEVRGHVVAPVLAVERNRHPDLAQVAGTRRLPRFGPRTGKNRKKNARKYSNDSNNHEELDERKPVRAAPGFEHGPSPFIHRLNIATEPGAGTVRDRTHDSSRRQPTKRKP